MSNRGRSARGDGIAVELLYSRSEWFCCDPDGAPFRGGYIARIPSFRDQGEGRTADHALEDLAHKLWTWVKDWDAEADEYELSRRSLDRLNHFEEPELLRWARAELTQGELLEVLRRAAGDPVLDRVDESALRS